MRYTIVQESEETDYPIRPSHINISKHMFDAFGNMLAEVSAHYIVSLCQKAGYWKPFTKEEIEAEYQSAFYHGYTFNSLLTDEFVVEVGNKFYVTHEFVCRCFKSSPSKTIMPI